jgi:hypothetical protein
LRAAAVDFDQAWPVARSHIASVLGARGVQGADVDDVAQEVAVRALRDRDRFISHEHFVRWCCRVAINLQIDVARSQRRLSPEVAPERAAPHDTAVAAERNIALDALTAEIAELSLEDQRLLLDPEPVESRREAVRLAVRRHRIRARLAALVEGMLAGFPVLRRLPRSLSTPAKVGLVAVPAAVAGFLIAPHLEPAPPAPAIVVERPASWVPAPPARTVDRPVAGGGGSPQSPAVQRTSATAATLSTTPRDTSRTYTELNHPALPPVKVSSRDRPDDRPGLCIFGHVNACLNRPGTTLPLPALP